MSDPSPAKMDVSTAPKRRSWLRNLSFIWLVPILALALSLGLAWQSYSQRGVMIEIIFPNALGVHPGETELRYRDVTIGNVETVNFTPDLTKVVVHARVSKEIAPYLDDEAMFWIVSPQVTTRGISGLSTVLSGVYIEGAWDQERGAPVTRFFGSENPPLVQPGRPGKRITLLATDGRLISEGAPVLFRGVEVGRLEKPRLTLGASDIVVDAFIEAPHDRRLNTATRFWDTSGFEVNLSASGLSVDFQSIASLVSGGVQFDSIYEDGRPIEPGYIFTVYPDEGTARKSIFTRAPTQSVEVLAAFGESVAGLEPGADVRLNGLKVGQVAAITANVEETDEGPNLRPLARLALSPDDLGLNRGASQEEALKFLEAAVANGFRARLAPASLFSGSLIVELVDVPDAEPATIRQAPGRLPEVPTIASNMPDFTATAEDMFQRINKLPIEKAVDTAISLMSGIESLVRQDSTRAVPDNIAAFLSDARGLINEPELRALPGELRDTVSELRGVLTDLRDGGAVDNVNSAMGSARDAADAVAAATTRLPALADRLNALVDRADAVMAAYDNRSSFNAETVAALREVRSAARAVSQLARAIERNPNSLLIGR